MAWNIGRKPLRRLRKPAPPDIIKKMDSKLCILDLFFAIKTFNIFVNPESYSGLSLKEKQELVLLDLIHTLTCWFCAQRGTHKALMKAFSLCFWHHFILTIIHDTFDYLYNFHTWLCTQCSFWPWYCWQFSSLSCRLNM